MILGDPRTHIHGLCENDALMARPAALNVTSLAFQTYLLQHMITSPHSSPLCSPA